MEAGDTTESGAPALFEKLPVFWPIAQRRPEFPRFYKQIIELRHSSSALRRGSLNWLKNSDESRVVTFMRRSAEEEMLVAINFSSLPVSATLEDIAATGFTDVTPDIGPPLPPDAPVPERKARDRSITLPALTLEAWGYRIYRRSP